MSKEIGQNNSFGPESTNPRQRRAFAHAIISKYKKGYASYQEAFEAAYKASQSQKGRKSNFGKPLGDVFVDAFTQCFDNNTVIVAGLSPSKQKAVAIKRAIGQAFSYSFDAYMVRPDANNVPSLKGVIKNPIKEGFSPLK